jgi:hypothetical protein
LLSPFVTFLGRRQVTLLGVRRRQDGCPNRRADDHEDEPGRPVKMALAVGGQTCLGVLDTVRPDSLSGCRSSRSSGPSSADGPARYDFLFLKAGPAGGGLRRPSSAGSTATVRGLKGEVPWLPGGAGGWVAGAGRGGSGRASVRSVGCSRLVPAPVVGSCRRWRGSKGCRRPTPGPAQP